MRTFQYRLFSICLVVFLSTASLAIAQDPTTIVKNAYQDVLGRQPDSDGMRTFRSKIIDEGWTEQQVRATLRNSPEYKQEGSSKIVTRAYEDILNRRADRAGMELYRNHILNDNWSEKQVRDNLRQSQEYQNMHK